LGIVESAIIHWDSHAQDPQGTQRLADLGATIVQSRKEGEGEEFLKQINRFAFNQSYNSAVTAPRAGDRLADLLLADLNRTHKPQALGLELPGGRRHALVVWDAEKTNGKIVFSVGDPDYPDRNNLRLVYDPDAKSWVDLGYKNGEFPKGDITPCFIRWDEKNQRPGEIPNRGKFEELFQRVEVAAQNPEITALSIGKDFVLETPSPFVHQVPDTIRHALDRPPSKPGTADVVGTWVCPETGGVYTFERDGRFACSEGSGTWRQTGDGVEAVVSGGDGISQFTFTIRITLQDGQAHGEWNVVVSQGRADPDHGSIELRRQ